MQLQEALLCSTGASSSNPGPGAITLHDLQTGSSLASFKQTNALPNSTAVVQTRNGQGGFMLAAQPDKPILNAYTFQKDQIAVKTVLPEKLSCIAVDKEGTYCAGGTALGRIYFWEIASGILFNVWDAHYQKVSVLQFTQDGAGLVSGADDSGLHVWSVSRLLANELQHELPTPYCSLSDHTLAVTDIVCGIGGFPSCRILSSSLDHSVKLWDLSSRTLLSTFMFPNPIVRLAFEMTERTFFAASSDVSGSIYQVKLYRRREKEGRQITGFEAVGGGGVSEVNRLDANPKRMINVGQPISAMAMSLNASTLLVGTAAGLVHSYDIASHQLLKTASSHKGLTITYLAAMLRPPDLIGHVSLNISATGGGAGGSINAKDVMPTRPIAPFQRVRDGKAREAHEVPMMLPMQMTALRDTLPYRTDELLRDHAFFVQPSDDAAVSVTSNNANSSHIANLEGEVQNLREQLAKARSINDTMWEKIVQRAVTGAKDKSASGDAMEVSRT